MRKKRIQTLQESGIGLTSNHMTYRGCSRKWTPALGKVNQIEIDIHLIGVYISLGFP
jgi:hypothetical protein